jgi:hypothetical protein
VADAEDGRELKRRLTALPGFGDQKARIFVALLGKQCGVQPDGWREAAGEYGEEGYRSIADVTSPETLAKVREFKQARKAAAKAAKGLSRRPAAPGGRRPERALLGHDGEGEQQHRREPHREHPGGRPRPARGSTATRGPRAASGPRRWRPAPSCPR